MSSPLGPQLLQSPRLSTGEFEAIRSLVYERFGIDLAGKQALVAGRLSKMLRRAGVASFEEYFACVRADRSGESLLEMVDALTTNHTSFFREPQHFALLRDAILPSLAKVSHLRIWSAACSTGEEPYSIAFLLSDIFGSTARGRASILATDISRRALEHAARAMYPLARVQEISADRRQRFFVRDSSAPGMLGVAPIARDLVSFRRVNLMENFSALGSFHIIFCRNVMIYFDRVTQQRLVQRLWACLEPGGYLLIGHAESLSGFSHPLEYVQPATYRKPTNRAVLAAGRLT